MIKEKIKTYFGVFAYDEVSKNLGQIEYFCLIRFYSITPIHIIGCTYWTLIICITLPIMLIGINTLINSNVQIQFYILL